MCLISYLFSYRVPIRNKLKRPSQFCSYLTKRVWLHNWYHNITFQKWNKFWLKYGADLLSLQYVFSTLSHEKLPLCFTIILCRSIMIELYSSLYHNLIDVVYDNFCCISFYFKTLPIIIHTLSRPSHSSLSFLLLY